MPLAAGNGAVVIGWSSGRVPVPGCGDGVEICGGGRRCWRCGRRWVAEFHLLCEYSTAHNPLPVADYLHLSVTTATFLAQIHYRLCGECLRPLIRQRAVKRWPFRTPPNRRYRALSFDWLERFAFAEQFLQTALPRNSDSPRFHSSHIQAPSGPIKRIPRAAQDIHIAIRTTESSTILKLDRTIGTRPHDEVLSANGKLQLLVGGSLDEQLAKVRALE